MKKYFFILSGLATALLLFVVIQNSPLLTAGEVRTMQFGWGSIWGMDDTYRLTIPGDYGGCSVRVIGEEECYSQLDGQSGPSENLKTSVDGGCNSTSCEFSVSPGEVFDITFSRTGALYCNPSYYDDVMEDYQVYKFGYCGDGRCGQGPYEVGTCVNGITVDEFCSNCPEDCGACASTLKDDGESCSLDSECLGEYCVHNICRAWPFYFGDGYCDADEGESCSDPNSEYCSPDCEVTTYKENGGSCSGDSECSSGNCGSGVCCQDGTTCCQKDADCWETDTFCKLSENVCYYKGDDDIHSCTEWRECKGGYCVHAICRSAAYYCGDRSCDSDYEDCNSCSTDCGACAETTTNTNTASLKSNGESCSADSECSGSNCVHSICRSSSTYCGDDHCDTGETCSSCSADCGECEEEEEETTIDSSELKDLLYEYKNVFNYLDTKIDVSELDQLNVSPSDMHEAIESLARSYVDTESVQKGVELLKAAIAAEELGIAVYEAEEEMAGVIAESSWQSLKAYLFYKIKAIIASRLEALAANPELKSFVDDFTETASTVAKSYSEGGQMGDDELAEVLGQLGITDEAQAEELIKATNSALSEAAGGIMRYMEAIESYVHNKYVEIYKEMFMANFAEAISTQVVYFQAGLWHHTENLGDIKNGSTPYQQYQEKIDSMKAELATRKDFVLGGDNVFDKSKGMTDKFVKTTEEIGKFLDEAALAGKAIDKGASLLKKEVAFEEVVNKVKEYNDNLNSALEAAGEVIELAGIFTESLFGTYQEAKVYGIFFNSMSDWCDTVMGDCVAVLRVPGTDYKVDIEALYELGRAAGYAIDLVGVQAGTLAYRIADSAEDFTDEIFKAFNEVAETAKVKIKEGEKIIKDTVYNAVEGAGNQLVGLVSWGSSWFGYDDNYDFSIVREAWADEKSVIEFALISPSGVRYPGALTPNGLGSYVVVDNPVSGTWKTEIVGKQVDGTEEVQIALNVSEIKSGETKETLPGYSKKSDNDWIFYAIVIGIITVVVVTGWFAVKYGMRYIRRKKASKVEKFKDKIEPVLEKVKLEKDKQEHPEKFSRRLTWILLAYFFIGGITFLASAFIQGYFGREYYEFGWPWVAGNAVAGFIFLYFYHHIQKKRGVKSKILSLVILAIFIVVGVFAVMMPGDFSDAIIDIFSYPITVGGIFIPLILLVYFAKAIIWTLRKIRKRS